MRLIPSPILPRLDEGEFEELKRSIAQHGILTPLLIDHKGHVIDGHERLRALGALGLGTDRIPLRVFGKMTEADRLEYAIRVNSERRHLTRAERARLLERLILAAPSRSTREVADLLKVGKSTAGRAKQKVLAGVPDGTPGTILGRDGKTYQARAATSVENLAHARIVAPLFDEVAATSGGISPRGLKRLVLSNRIDEIARGSTPALAGEQRLHLGDFRSVGRSIPDGSVDIGIVDPPWNVEWSPSLGPLIREYARILKPGSLVVVHTSPEQIPSLLGACREADLEWYWLLASLKPQGQTLSKRRGNVQNQYRPIAVLKAPGEIRCGSRSICDVIRVEHEPREFHEWQHPVGESLAILSSLSRPGWTVADLTCGSATSGVAAARLGMRWVGCEIDPRTCEVARKRLHEAIERRP